MPGPHLRRLKSMGQLLDPVVHIGKGGLTEALLASVNLALTDHELIKVKFDAHKEEKKVLAPELAVRTSSRLIQRVGNVVVLYRAHPDPEKRKIRFREAAEGVEEGGKSGRDPAGLPGEGQPPLRTL